MKRYIYQNRSGNNYIFHCGSNELIRDPQLETAFDTYQKDAMYVVSTHIGTAVDHVSSTFGTHHYLVTRSDFFRINRAGFLIGLHRENECGHQQNQGQRQGEQLFTSFHTHASYVFNGV